MALLQAVQHSDSGNTVLAGAAAGWGAGPAGCDDMDWAGLGEDYADLGDGGYGYGRRAGHRHTSAGDDAYNSDVSFDSEGDQQNHHAGGYGRGDAAAFADELLQMDAAVRGRKQPRGPTGRFRRGASDEAFLYGEEFDRVAQPSQRGVGGAGGGAAGRGKGGHKLARGVSPAVREPKERKQRCVAGANQWVTEDGLTVWPKVGFRGMLALESSQHDASALLCLCASETQHQVNTSHACCQHCCLFKASSCALARC